MSTLRLNEIKFCAEECLRQESGEVSVYNMCAALAHAIYVSNTFCRFREMSLEGKLQTVLDLGKLVEPEKNKGFRKTEVRFADFSFALKAELIEPALRQLLTNCDEIFPDQFYQEFEEIHPFIDGNGRVGAILYNILTDWGELHTPPKFKKKVEVHESKGVPPAFTANMKPSR